MTGIQWTAIRICCAGLTFVTAIFIIRWRRRHTRRRHLMECDLSSKEKQFIEKNITLYNRLPKELKTQLSGLVNVFLSEKKFVGCNGLEMTDEIKVTIAAQACILLLNRKTRFYPKLKTIYVYPHTYVAKSQQNDGGWVVEGKSIRLGESWQNGPVVLAWDSIVGGARNIQDRRNVVLHEFAHQLDQENGDADGTPILENRSSYRTWAAVLSKEYDKLKNNTHSQTPSVLDTYGAANPAEFFAVATEAFFEKPHQMQKISPDLYEELKRFYKTDPLSWARSS